MSGITKRNTVNSVKAATSDQQQHSPSLIAKSPPSNSGSDNSSSSSSSSQHSAELEPSSSDPFVPSASTRDQLFPSSQTFNELTARVQLLENLLKEKDDKLQLLNSTSNSHHQQHASPHHISPSHVASSSSSSSSTQSATAMFNSALSKSKLLQNFSSHLSSPHFNYQYSKNDDEEKYSLPVDINEELRKERNKKNKTKIKNNYTSSHSADVSFSSSQYSHDDSVSCRKCGEWVQAVDSILCNNCITYRTKKKILIKQQVDKLKSNLHLPLNSSSSSSCGPVLDFIIQPSSFNNLVDDGSNNNNNYYNNNNNDNNSSNMKNNVNVNNKNFNNDVNDNTNKNNNNNKVNNNNDDENHNINYLLPAHN